MSLDKGIAHGKELRKPYYKSGKFDPTCRPGGGCPYCKGNRMHSTKRRELSAREQIKEAVKRNVSEASFASPPSPGAYDQRPRRVKEDLRVLGGLVEQISDWANGTDYLTTAEQAKISRLCMELGYVTGEVSRRLKV